MARINALGEADRLATRDWFFAVRANHVPGWRALRKFGSNPVVGATFEAIWSGGATYPFQSTYTTLSVVSGTPADGTAGGTGATQVTFAGLDANWEWASETFTMSGTAAVTGTTTFSRVFRGGVDAVGTFGQSNVGSITAAINGTTVAIIPGGQGQTQMSVWSNASTGTAYIGNALLSVDGTNSSDFQLRIRENANNVTGSYGAVRTLLEFKGLQAFASVPIDSYIKVPPNTDVWWEAQRGGGQNVAISADFDAFYIHS